MSGNKLRPAGSLKSGEPAFLVAGKVRRPHGVEGAIVVEIHSHFPEELREGKKVYVGGMHEELVILSRKNHKEGLLLKFEGINTPEEVGRFRNQLLFVSARESPGLADGEYYFHELFDIEVFEENGTLLGTLVEILETGANDVYVISQQDGKEILLPAIPDVIKKVDRDLKQMTVRLLPGLLDESGVDA